MSEQAPEQQPEPVEPTVEPTVEPVPVKPVLVEPHTHKRIYIPATGVQISQFLRAVEGGMADTGVCPWCATEDEISAFVGGAR